jgi:glucose/mannose-6-phosphate isomerase
VSRSAEEHSVNLTAARTLLDANETYQRLDPHSMGRVIARLDEQSLDAWNTGQSWRLPDDFRTPDRVIITGMGGSAIGGDIAATIARINSTIPVEVIRGYITPPTTTGTLTIANSLSGNTEETLTAFEQARNGPGMRMAITTGGKLSKMGEPTLRLHWEHPPRAGIGWNLFPLLAILQRLDVLAIDNADVEATSAALTTLAATWGADVPTDDNRAKQLALQLHDQLPVIVGVEFLEVVARRWAGQIQENAKQWAFWTALPEMDHNLLNGIGLPATSIDQLEVIFLDAKLTHHRNRQRVTLTAEELSSANIANERVITHGSSTLETIMRSCYLGDWVSYYLAMLNESDPTQTGVIERFKERMNKPAVGE